MNATTGNSYLIKAEDAGWYFRATSRATDSAEPPNTLNNNSNVLGPVEQPVIYEQLTVQAPTLTGDPCVGYTLSCSQPDVTGGSGNYQFDYFWVDETNVIVWEAAKMAPTTTVTEYDLGKTMKCLVTVSDKEAEGVNPVTVESSSTIAAFRPTLGDFQTYVDNVLIEQTTVGLTPSQICMCLVQEDDPVLFPPKDVSFNWQVRTGTGRLSGDNGGPFIGYVAPDTAPAGALLTCTINSDHAQDATDVAIEFLIADP